MTILQIIFIVVALVIIVAALMTVTSSNLVHAGMWLILSLAGIAVTFVILEATFLAVVQVAVYIDAIAILIIMVIMLTRKAMSDTQPKVNPNWLWAALAAFIIFGGLLLMFNQAPAMSTEPPPLVAGAESTLENLGQALVDLDQFIIPFELASVLLLAALIGSIFIARPPNSESEGEG